MQSQPPQQKINSPDAPTGFSRFLEHSLTKVGPEFAEQNVQTQKAVTKTSQSSNFHVTIQDYFKHPVIYGRDTLVQNPVFHGKEKPYQAVENYPSIESELLAEHPSSVHLDRLTAKSDVLQEAPKEIQLEIKRASRKYNIPQKLIASIMKTESNFNPRAVSHVGAQGLMQLMPQTAKSMGVTNSFNIKQNIDGGARYFRKMLDNFGQDTQLALAAYNAGPGAVKKYGGIPPFKETQQYVKRVMHHYSERA